MMMRFEWDENKNRENLAKHGLDFADAWELFDGPMLVALDDREHYGEDRWIAIGLLRNLVAVVVYTEPEDETIRLISLRKALSHERQRFEDSIADGLAPG